MLGRHPFFAVAAGVSLLLCLFLSDLWQSSWRGQVRGWVWMKRGQAQQARMRVVVVSGGVLTFGWQAEVEGTGSTTGMVPDGFSRLGRFDTHYPSLGVHRYPGGGQVRSPAWLAVLITALLPARWVQLHRRRARREAERYPPPPSPPLPDFTAANTSAAIGRTETTHQDDP